MKQPHLYEFISLNGSSKHQFRGLCSSRHDDSDPSRHPVETVGRLSGESKENSRNNESAGKYFACLVRKIVSLKDFVNVFTRKREKSMQERAEKSREKKDTQTEIDESVSRIGNILDEIKGKKKHG